MITDPFHPTFLIRSLLVQSGYPRIDPSTFTIELNRFFLNSPGWLEQIWTSLEGLILALTLAGYECPELIVATPWGGDPARDIGYLQLYPNAAVVPYNKGDWRARTGVSVGSDAWVVFLIRVKTRRTLGTTSLYPPISLAGIPTYHVQVDQTDRLADPADGWIALVGTTPNQLPHEAAVDIGEQTRIQVADALATAWEHEADQPVGLLRSFDPSNWETAVDREYPVQKFAATAAEIWAALQQPGQLRPFLEAGIEDRAACLGGLAELDGVSTPYTVGLRELRKRLDAFHANHASVKTLTQRWARQHWALTLFELHEFGLVRIMPFLLHYDDGIPNVDLTGWYETVAEDSASSGQMPQIATMQLNQAGEFLEGWWYEAQLDRWDLGSIQAPSPGDPPGTLTFDVIFTRAGWDDSDGTIHDIPAVDGGPHDFALMVTSEGVDYPMIRTSRLAQISPALRIAALGTGSATPSEAHIAKLHTLSDLGLTRSVEILVDGVVKTSTQVQTSWPSLMRTVESNLRTTLANNNILFYSGTQVPASPMLDRFRADAQLRLQQTAVPAADGRDAWNQLYVILNALDLAGEPAAATLRALLGIGPSTHEYTTQFVGVGVVAEVDDILGVGAGSMGIAGTITHEASCGTGTGPHGFTDYYYGSIVEGAISAGPEEGFGVNIVRVADPDTVWTSSEWLADDFSTTGLCIPPRCSFVLVGGSGQFNGRLEIGIEGGWDIIEAQVYVSRTAIGVAAGLNDGWFVNIGAGLSIGLGAGGGVTIGSLYSRVGLAGHPAPQPPPPESPPVSVDLDAGKAAFFATGEADLTPVGRVFLSQYVARYRALFESPLSTVIFEGDASPAGPDAFNETLSWKRALTLYAEIRGLLSAPPSGDWGPSNALAIGESRVQLVAYGETRPRLAGVPDGLDPKAWRRSKVLVNGTVMAFV